MFIRDRNSLTGQNGSSILAFNKYEDEESDCGSRYKIVLSMFGGTEPVEGMELTTNKAWLELPLEDALQLRDILEDSIKTTVKHRG